MLSQATACLTLNPNVVKYTLLPFRMRCRAVSQIRTDVSEEPTATVFRIGDRGSITETFALIYQNTWRHIPQDSFRSLSRETPKYCSIRQSNCLQVSTLRMNCMRSVRSSASYMQTRGPRLFSNMLKLFFPVRMKANLLTGLLSVAAYLNIVNNI